MLHECSRDERRAAYRASAAIEREPEVAKPNRDGFRLYEDEPLIFVAYRLENGQVRIVGILRRTE